MSMSESQELIVRFKKGVSEDDAKKIAEGASAKVRRRMRGDSPDEVTLLLRIAGNVSDVESELKKNSSVIYTEQNTGGFKPMN